MQDKLPAWALGPFLKDERPVLEADANSKFDCPVLGRPVHWEATNVYNPAMIVRDGLLHMIYRADDEPLDFSDTFGNPMVTSRMGHAVSCDGIRFERDARPVLYPDNDACNEFEWSGGCQDLHIVEDEDGRYYMNYTAWTGRYDSNGPAFGEAVPETWEDVLLTASSDDLIHWTKHGPAFRDARYRHFLNHSRSGVVVSYPRGNRLVAAKIGGKYWMYVSMKGWLATSEDLITWEPVLDERGGVKCLFPEYVPGGYADGACEAGAAALLTERGILYFFNAEGRAPFCGLPAGTWSLGQALVDAEDMTTVLDVMDQPFLKPEHMWEKNGHCANPATVCNSLVFWDGTWTLYYGAADRCIGRAVARQR